MKYTFQKEDWLNLDQGEKNCYLLTNGRGGFQSLSVIGSAVRQDHALFMSAKKAPNVRFHYLTNMYEEIVIDGKPYVLTSQKMYEGEDLRGFQYLESFTFETYPVWTFRIEDVVLEKRAIMVHGSETVALQYRLLEQADHEVILKAAPLLRFTAKNDALSRNHATMMEAKVTENQIIVKEDTLFFKTTGQTECCQERIFGPMYFTQDERDGRDFIGYCFSNHQIVFDASANSDMSVIYSKGVLTQKDSFSQLLAKEQQYTQKVCQKADLTSELGKQLVWSADAYIVDRESTNGKTIIAGYPFFEDWGRDTMISLPGMTLTTGRFEECKSILRTFAKYEKQGLLPNLFPEGDKDPMYNSCDAPLLFINAVYEYVNNTKDEAFLDEVWGQLEEIMQAYQQGTQYHISMDEDGLIQAGDALEQLTWMDVRVGDYLPTPRHGKPVEINAYWYNALCIMAEWTKKREHGVLSAKAEQYQMLANKVKESFLSKFWNEEEQCLKDVLNGTQEENQVRCNQIWALSFPYTMLSPDLAKKVIDKVTKELYTPVGLRTLSRKDAAFHGIYIGGMVNRDRAYHQGTVWAFPLGAYYRACIRYMKDIKKDPALEQLVATGMEQLKDWLAEGCVGHLAEIYDGEEPTVSRGCFAQAWSDGELLRAVYDWEHYFIEH